MKILFISTILLLPMLIFAGKLEAANYQIQTQKIKKVRRLKKRTFRTYITGQRGGCYYMNGSGKKTYVSRSLCSR